MPHFHKPDVYLKKTVVSFVVNACRLFFAVVTVCRGLYIHYGNYQWQPAMTPACCVSTEPASQGGHGPSTGACINTHYVVCVCAILYLCISASATGIAYKYNSGSSSHCRCPLCLCLCRGAGCDARA